MGWHDVVGDAGRSRQHRALRRLRRPGHAVPRVRHHRRRRRQGREGLHQGGQGRRDEGPGVTETNPARAAQSASTDVMGDDAQTGSGKRRPRGRRIRYEQGEVTSMTNPNTQALADAGVSIWLDDLSRELIETGKISRAHRGAQRRRRDDEPVDLPGRPVQGRALQRRPRRADQGRQGRRRGRLRAHDLRRAQRVRPLPPALRVDRRGSTAASPSRSTRAWPTTPTRPSSRPSSCMPPSTARTSSSRSPRRRQACRRSRPPSPRASAST